MAPPSRLCTYGIPSPSLYEWNDAPEPTELKPYSSSRDWIVQITGSPSHTHCQGPWKLLEKLCTPVTPATPGCFDNRKDATLLIKGRKIEELICLHMNKHQHQKKIWKKKKSHCCKVSTSLPRKFIQLLPIGHMTWNKLLNPLLPGSRRLVWNLAQKTLRGGWWWGGGSVWRR